MNIDTSVINAVNGGGSSGMPARQSQELRESFLTLLITQLQNQDPLNPMNNEDFVAQLAQFSSLEQLQGVNTQLETLNMVNPSMNNASMVNLLGQDVVAISDTFHYSGEGSTEIHYNASSAITSGSVVIQNEDGDVVATLPLDAADAEALAQVRPTRAEFLASYGKPGGGPGEFNRAEGIGVDAQDRLYVADSCNHRVQVFTSDGKFIREFGKPGSAPGELSYPYDVKVDAAGNVFVCEFGNSRIQVFDGAGKSIELIGGAGGRPGQFNNPWGIALDSHGNIYVADALNHRVQKLVRHGQTAAVVHGAGAQTL